MVCRKIGQYIREIFVETWEGSRTRGICKGNCSECQGCHSPGRLCVCEAPLSAERRTRPYPLDSARAAFRGGVCAHGGRGSLSKHHRLEPPPISGDRRRARFCAVGVCLRKQ